MNRENSIDWWCYSVLMSLFAVTGMLIPCGVHGQSQGTLTGIVVAGEAEERVSGVTIRLLDAGLETETASDGTFSFRSVPPGDVTLRADRDGYSSVVETLRISNGEDSYLRIRIDRFQVLLDELLVPGRRSDASGDDDEHRSGEDDGARTAADLLAERIPGVQLRRNQGSAGGGANIRLRGASSLFLSNAPAIYLDGVLLSSNPSSLDTRASSDLHVLEQLPAGLVERIRVLRGPAAATRYPNAANGVIIIETHERTEPR